MFAQQADDDPNGGNGGGQRQQQQQQQQHAPAAPPPPETGPWVWYMEMPVVSRVYLTAAVLATAACALEVVSPFHLYFNLGLIKQGQLWRLVTNFVYFGNFSLDFVFHMYFLARYCRLLEEGTFRGRTADFVYMILLGAAMITCIAPFIRPSIPFLGSSLTFMMVYVWGRRNEHVRLTFLNLFPFTAPYLPWVLLAFSVVLGNPATVDIIGIVVGHTYYFLEFTFPLVAEARGWPMRKLLRTPALLHYLCGTHPPHDDRDADGGLGLRVDFVQPPMGVGVGMGAPVAGGAGAGAGDGQPQPQQQQPPQAAAAGAAGGGGHLHED